MGRKKVNYWIRFDPATHEEMVGTHQGWKFVTLCRLLKEIYRDSDNEDIKFKCRVAVSIASSLAERITVHEGTRWGKIQYPKYIPFMEELIRKDRGDYDKTLDLPKMEVDIEDDC